MAENQPLSLSSEGQSPPPPSSARSLAQPPADLLAGTDEPAVNQGSAQELADNLNGTVTANGVVNPVELVPTPGETSVSVPVDTQGDVAISPAPAPLSTRRDNANESGADLKTVNTSEVASPEPPHSDNGDKLMPVQDTSAAAGEQGDTDPTLNAEAPANDEEAKSQPRPSVVDADAEPPPTQTEGNAPQTPSPLSPTPRETVAAGGIEQEESKAEEAGQKEDKENVEVPETVAAGKRNGSAVALNDASADGVMDGAPAHTQHHSEIVSQEEQHEMDPKEPVLVNDGSKAKADRKESVAGKALEKALETEKGTVVEAEHPNQEQSPNKEKPLEVKNEEHVVNLNKPAEGSFLRDETQPEESPPGDREGEGAAGPKTEVDRRRASSQKEGDEKGHPEARRSLAPDVPAEEGPKEFQPNLVDGKPAVDEHHTPTEEVHDLAKTATSPEPTPTLKEQQPKEMEEENDDDESICAQAGSPTFKHMIDVFDPNGSPISSPVKAGSKVLAITEMAAAENEEMDEDDLIIQNEMKLLKAELNLKREVEFEERLRVRIEHQALEKAQQIRTDCQYYARQLEIKLYNEHLERERQIRAIPSNEKAARQILLEDENKALWDLQDEELFERKQCMALDEAGVARALEKERAERIRQMQLAMSEQLKPAFYALDLDEQCQRWHIIELEDIRFRDLVTFSDHFPMALLHNEQLENRKRRIIAVMEDLLFQDLVRDNHPMALGPKDGELWWLSRAEGASRDTLVELEMLSRDSIHFEMSVRGEVLSLCRSAAAISDSQLVGSERANWPGPVAMLSSPPDRNLVFGRGATRIVGTTRRKSSKTSTPSLKQMFAPGWDVAANQADWPSVEDNGESSGHHFRSITEQIEDEYKRVKDGILIHSVDDAVSKAKAAHDARLAKYAEGLLPVHGRFRTKPKPTPKRTSTAAAAAAALLSRQNSSASKQAMEAAYVSRVGGLLTAGGLEQYVVPLVLDEDIDSVPMLLDILFLTPGHDREIERIIPNADDRKKLRDVMSDHLPPLLGLLHRIGLRRFIPVFHREEVFDIKTLRTLRNDDLVMLMPDNVARNCLLTATEQVGV